MAEPLRHSYEVEEESKTIEVKPLPPALPETPPSEINAGPYVVGKEPLSTTERLGSAVGTKVGEAVDSLQSRVRSGMDVVARKSKDAGDALGDAAEAAQEKARQWSEDASIRMDELRRTTRRRVRQAQEAARRTANEHPLETILAIGAAGLVIGFLLRIWRANSD